MNTTLTLTASSIKMFVRNKQSLFFTLFMPVIIMTIFGFIGFDRIPKTHLGIVTNKPTESTTQFISQLEKIEAFEITQSKSEQDEVAALKKGDREVVLVVPDTLMPDPTSTQPPQKQTLQAYTNVSQPQQVQAAMSILTQILDKTTLQVAQAPQLFELKAQEVSSKNQKYIDFLLPGIVAMAIMQMSIFSVAFVFTDYKEKGVMKRLLATPMKPYQFVTANVVTRLIIAILQAAVLIAIGVLAFNSQVVGSVWLVLLITFLGSIMFLGMGFAVSGFAKTVESVPAIANIVAFPMLFLGGVFFPIDAMPNWLQHIVQYMPLTYFAHALREVMASGVNFSGISTDIYWMLGWSIALIGLAVYAFRFEEKRA